MNLLPLLEVLEGMAERGCRCAAERRTACAEGAGRCERAERRG